MDDATWGLFQEGWGVPNAGRETEAGLPAMGADADHLKTPVDIDVCVAAGFSFFTLDPGDHVDATADTAPEAELRAAFAALPWEDLETSPADLAAAYPGRRFAGEDEDWQLDEATVVRSAVKYGRAIAHTTRLYRHLAAAVGGTFDLELSVDETETPTTHAEHIFIANELRRLGVRWTGLAPRYAGSFEKAVDYIGDLGEFERSFAGHAAIARALGPYKLSLHSGSDKFSIYPIAARHTRGLLHLKTAGTSYLEALRAVAVFDPALFRALLAFALARFPTDRATYQVSTHLERVPAPDALADPDLPALLDRPDARQVLHLTFGSVLNPANGLRERLLAGLAAHEEEHYRALERHFVRHLAPLAGATGSQG
jgi:tagaturonate epimerase